MKNKYQMELSIKEEVLLGMLQEIKPTVEDFEVNVYEEIDRLISGRVTIDKVSYKIQKSYEEQLTKLTEGRSDEYKVLILNHWLKGIQNEIEPILKVGQVVTLKDKVVNNTVYELGEYFFIRNIQVRKTKCQDDMYIVTLAQNINGDLVGIELEGFKLEHVATKFASIR